MASSWIVYRGKQEEQQQRHLIGLPKVLIGVGSLRYIRSSSSSSRWGLCCCCCCFPPFFVGSPKSPPVFKGSRWRRWKSWSDIRAIVSRKDTHKRDGREGTWPTRLINNLLSIFKWLFVYDRIQPKADTARILQSWAMNELNSNSDHQVLQADCNQKPPCFIIDFLDAN